MTILRSIAVLALVSLSGTAWAADYPAPKEGDWVARDFKFHTGEVMPELKLHYTTIGDPAGIPVVVLHGSGGSAASMLTPAFAGELFGSDSLSTQPNTTSSFRMRLAMAKAPSRPMGSKRNFPDTILRTWSMHSTGCYPKAWHRHVRLIIGNSMGGMNAWLWGQKYPGYMDALVPMASQPTAMASRSWMLQRMMLEIVRNDPDYNNGNYVTQPRLMKIASVFFGIATAGGTLNYQSLAPTREKADELVDMRLAAAATADANDLLWQWGSSADYDASPGLEKIDAAVLAINAADDERNPPETGLMARAMQRIKNGRLYLILTSDETSGHLTTGHAKFYKQVLQRLLDAVPRRAM